MMNQFNLKEKFSLISEYWTPKIVGELNGQYVKLAKLKGEFIWHAHKDEDELFMIVKGELGMEFRDHTSYSKAGDILIIPKGIEHKPFTKTEEVWVMLFEPKETKHTGEIMDERTVEKLEWI